MGTTDWLKIIGMWLIVPVFIAAGIVVVIAFIWGASWLSLTVFPWLVPTFFWALAISVLILTPAALIPSHATKVFSCFGFMIASYVFGCVLWIWAFIATMAIWGVWGVVIGLFFAGIGILPVALLAELLHGQWSAIGDILLMATATYGSRLLAFFVASKLAGASVSVGAD